MRMALPVATTDSCDIFPGEMELSKYYLNTIFFSSIIISFVIFFSYFTFKFGKRLIDRIIDLLTVSVEITGPMGSCSDLYAFTISWLFENIPDWPHQFVVTKSERDDVGKIDTNYLKPPGFLTSPHYFKYDGVWIQVSRKRLAIDGVICDEVPIDSVTLKTLKWNWNILTKILEEIRTKFTTQETDESRTRYFFANDGSYWSEFGCGKRKRPLNSVILNENTLSSLVDDVREFINSEDWYRDRGIPYRRGYLLYGPPGNGKSSFVKAIAGEFGHSICMLSLSSSKNLNDDTLNLLMNTTEEKSIILLEDIDAAFPSRDIVDDDESNDKKSKKDLRSPEGDTSSGKVTLRGLLNALDGVASTEGRIVFLTTNHVQKLDPAMTRPGRVDMKVHIDLPNDRQLDRMFGRFYPEAEQTDITEFITAIRSLQKPVSMAMVQGLFMVYKQSHTDAITKTVNFFNDQYFELKKTDPEVTKW